MRDLSHEQGFTLFGPGEQEAIAIARQSGLILLINDNRARLWAVRQGLEAYSVPGFLVSCKEVGIVGPPEIRELVLALQEKDRYSFRKDVLALLLP